MGNQVSLPPGVKVNDSLKNVATGLGDLRYDKVANTEHQNVILSDHQLITAFRSSWIIKKAVQIPAFDALRKGRDWQAEEDQITMIEAEEKRLGVRQKLVECKWKARLFGGAAIVIGGGRDVDDYSKPFDPKTVGKGGITHLTVMTRRELNAGQIEGSIGSEFFGKPKEYILSGQGVQQLTVHPSRLVVMLGDPNPDPWNAVVSTSNGWSDSVLVNIYTAVLQAESSLANVSNLIFEANVDEIGIPDFMAQVNDPEYREKFFERMILSNLMKGSTKSTIHDKDESYNRHSLTFQGLPDLISKFLLCVSGATDIPLTRFLGQTPSGLSSTGEGDMKNYHDRLQSMQELEIEPSLYRLDEALIYSATGQRDPDIFYNWSPLEQVNEKEQSEIAKNDAVTAEAYSRMGAFTPEEMRKVTSNRLIETGFYPGLAAAMNDTGEIDFGFDDPAPVDNTENNVGFVDQKDAKPRTLYVRRDVLNGQELVDWAKSQGFDKTLQADDLHVTIAYSEKPVDWFKVGEAWDDEIKIRRGGPRQMERLGTEQDAVVLLISNRFIKWRHEEILEAGASWKWPDFQAHVTIAFDKSNNVDLDRIDAYQGEIVLGPEIFEELNPDWKENVNQK